LRWSSQAGGDFVPRSIAFSHAYLSAVAAWIATFAAVYGIDAFLARIKLPAEATILDDTLLRFLVAILVFGIELRHQRELRRQQRHIAVIAEMNHHIRNALQTIVYATFNASDRHAVDEVREATKRIEWALREVRPAEPCDSEEHAGWPPVPPKSLG